MIKFNSVEIPGYHTTLVAQRPGLTVSRKQFFGLHGTSEVVGGRTGRQITCELWLTKKDWTNPAQLLDEVAKLDLGVGSHGIVTEIDHQTSPGISQKFRNCTFMGFERRALPGQSSPGPLQDLGKTLHDGYTNASQGAWFQFGILTWFQTAPGTILTVETETEP